MTTVALSSYAVQFPVGGYFSWVLQWLVGLRDLGYDVWFVERASHAGSCFDPPSNTMGDDCSYGTSSLHGLLDRFSLGDRWCFVDAHGKYHGQSRSTIENVLGGADLYIDMGANGTWDDETKSARRRVYVDGEPGFTQMKWALGGEPAATYDAYYTVGQNIGKPSNRVPTSGVAWRPLLYPVVTSMFPVVAPPADAPFTTVMSWSAHDRLDFEGVTYGAKDMEFPKFIDLPRRTRVPVEIAVNAHAPRSLLAEHGWRMRDALEVSSTFDQFCDYVRSSRGEFSVCKNGFVATRSGWVGDRIGAYLACGRPVVMQDTGFGERLPCGEGLFAVRDLDDAVDAIERIEADPERHRSAARAIAETHFEATTVLSGMLADLGLAP
jgi:hypothetical protein